MTDTQVTLILAHIAQLKDAVSHANVVTSDRLARLERTVADEGQRVTRLEGRVDADIHAREDTESGALITRERLWAFAIGVATVVIGLLAARAIPHL